MSDHLSVSFTPLKFTRTDYFTYFTDGNTGGTHRASAQVWTVNFKGDNRTYVIHVAGPNPQGPPHPAYNSFAKRHLLTFQGGKSHDGGDENPMGKMGKLHLNRQWEEIDEYTASRHVTRSALTVPNQAQYEAAALGPKSVVAPFTLVVCDEISPEELKTRFAAAMFNEAKGPPTGHGPWVAGTARHNVMVKFNTDCVWCHDYISNTVTKKNWIEVTVYCETVAGNTLTMHVVHLAR